MLAVFNLSITVTMSGAPSRATHTEPVAKVALLLGWGDCWESPQSSGTRGPLTLQASLQG